ncbi:hypothetical protein ASF69_01625 [Rhizobium sp. Leaf311]|nr:hypothetical protein ASF69_01625 [Rhizobium sp. Leaf311]
MDFPKSVAGLVVLDGLPIYEVLSRIGVLRRASGIGSSLHKVKKRKLRFRPTLTSGILRRQLVAKKIIWTTWPPLEAQEWCAARLRIIELGWSSTMMMPDATRRTADVCTVPWAFFGHCTTTWKAYTATRQILGRTGAIR